MNDKQTDKNRIGAGKAGPGRPKGSVNKVTKAVKDVIAGAAVELGGQDRLVEWAKSDPANERAFWASIYPKLLPLQLTGEDGGDIKTVTRVERVIVRPQNTDG